jgi:hypothetical protein
MYQRCNRSLMLFLMASKFKICGYHLLMFYYKEQKLHYLNKNDTRILSLSFHFSHNKYTSAEIVTVINKTRIYLALLTLTVL